MSYTVPPEPVAPRTKPSTVSAAVTLCYVVAAIELVSAILAFTTIDAQRSAMETAYADFPELRDVGSTFAVGAVIVGAVITLLFATGFVVLGILNAKGKNPARIVTWVLAGLGVCCFGFGAVGSAANSAFGGMGGGGTSGPDPAEVQRILNENLPSWYYPVSTGLSIIGLLAAIAIIVLLALPASNAYFRKPQPVWEPPAYPSIG